MSTIKILLVVTALAYVAFGVLLFSMQRQFIYSPTLAVAHNYHEEIFRINGESIKAVVLNQDKPKAILYFGGNVEAVEYNASDFVHLFPDYAVFLVKYRGYGGSTGAPEEKAIYSDALHIFDRLVVEYEDVSVIGRSLGSGVATYLAAERSVARMALITPYDSVESVAQKRYPIYPVPLLLKDKFDSASRAASIKTTTLMIVAEDDEIIDKDHALRLASKFLPKYIKVEVLKQTGHNNLSANPNYYRLLGEFFLRASHGYH